jgi:hypothetical protein
MANIKLQGNASGAGTQTIQSAATSGTPTITLPDATGTLLISGGDIGTPSAGTVTNLTGTASININGTVGATTANTGAFTTLSASSTVSGTGFTTYLASPPAIGGTAAAAGAFTTLSASSTVSGTGFSTYLASPPAIGGTAAAAGTFTTGTFNTSTVHKGATSGTITISAPSVAGTQSYTLPTALPAVNGYALTSTTGGVMSWAASGGGGGSPGGSNTQIQYNNAGSFAGSANLTFDGANVGVGTSPAAMFSAARAIQLGVGGIVEGRNSGGTVITMSANQYINTSSARTYIFSDFASYYTQINGQHQFWTAPSGTAGATATFTKVLELNKDQTVALQGASLQTGIGITFPATQSASTDANTLDDYEEGTWTPTFTCAGGSITLNGDLSRYTKVGRNVTLSGQITVSSISSPVGYSFIDSIPFAPASSPQGWAAASVYVDGMNALAGVVMQGRIYAGLQRLYFDIYTQATGSSGNGTSYFKAGSVVSFNVTYST